MNQHTTDRAELAHTAHDEQHKRLAERAKEKPTAHRIAARDARLVTVTAAYRAQRQPWQMMPAEWSAAFAELGWDPSGMSTPASHAAAGRQMMAQIARKAFLRYYLAPQQGPHGVRSVTHRDVVAAALEEGRPVPTLVCSVYGLEAPACLHCHLAPCCCAESLDLSDVEAWDDWSHDAAMVSL